MRIYKHWLLIDISNHTKIVVKQFNNLKEYLEKYPDSKLTVYNKDYGSIFHKVFCLETTQNYNELDLDCNSLFTGSIRRLERKPTDIEQIKYDFETLYNIYAVA